jgi:hypothetical protein
LALRLASGVVAPIAPANEVVPALCVVRAKPPSSVLPKAIEGAFSVVAAPSVVAPA